MNKLIFSLLAIMYSTTILLPAAIAREKPYGGKCLYIDEEAEDQKFRSCEVNIKQKTLTINFDKEQYQDDNKAISARNISEIASGEYAKKLLSDSGSIVSGILLGPINLIGKIFVPDRNYQQYIIEYKDAKGKKTATILNVNRSDAPEFQQELTVMTRKLITFRPGQTNTIINVGPDIDDIK
ncbi:MAG: hypothetical protein QNJ60_00920 [Xenococcaceae cyanobacterium MO_188.B19]|nr:hypothetical protein [Xenococcaceae cyanobacterium MO_188.B19]